MEFNETTYTATEAAGDVEICVSLMREFETVVEVQFITTDSSNLLNPARPGLDYQSRSIMLTFDEGSPRTLCDSVQLEADVTLENEESFLVNIISDEAAVRVLLGSTEVFIIDSDSELLTFQINDLQPLLSTDVTVEFDSPVYTGLEGDSLPVTVAIANDVVLSRKFQVVLTLSPGNGM